MAEKDGKIFCDKCFNRDPLLSDRFRIRKYGTGAKTCPGEQIDGGGVRKAAGEDRDPG